MHHTSSFLSSKAFSDVSLLALRIITAAIFLYAAYVKFGFWSATPGEGMPEGMLTLMKFLSVVETIGGLAVFVGFLTRLASAGLAIIMVGAVIIMQFSMGVGFSTATGPGWEFPLSVLGGCLILMAFGGGSWSVDEKWKRG